MKFVYALIAKTEGSNHRPFIEAIHNSYDGASAEIKREKNRFNRLENEGKINITYEKYEVGRFYKVRWFDNDSQRQCAITIECKCYVLQED